MGWDYKRFSLDQFAPKLVRQQTKCYCLQHKANWLFWRKKYGPINGAMWMRMTLISKLYNTAQKRMKTEWSWSWSWFCFDCFNLQLCSKLVHFPERVLKILTFLNAFSRKKIIPMLIWIGPSSLIYKNNCLWSFDGKAGMAHTKNVLCNAMTLADYSLLITIGIFLGGRNCSKTCNSKQNTIGNNTRSTDFLEK